MRILILFLLFPLFSTAFVHKNIQCLDIYKLQLKIKVHSDNLANIHNTRTKLNGPYHKKIVLCKNKNCQIRSRKQIHLRYQPEHPHARKNGYVRFPSINDHYEWQELNKAAKKLKRISKSSSCVKKTDQILNTFSINYNKASNIVWDELIFDENNNLITWSRKTKDGNVERLNYLDKKVYR